MGGRVGWGLIAVVAGAMGLLADGAGVRLEQPLDLQVVQRSSLRDGTIPIRGSAGAVPGAEVEACVVPSGEPGRGAPEKWVPVAGLGKDGRFEGGLRAPAGGWYEVRVRVRQGRRELGRASVARVGVGEVFVIAGQSNSANHGEERQTVQSGMVSAFDGKGWAFAHDPQPGASGGGGSFIPVFADEIARRFGVPVGIVATGAGGTSVREWLPAGSRFPNPPTVLGNVKALPSGEWESRGGLYANLVARMRSVGPTGFRAVLWHQGESDANQADPGRTLAGRLYTEYLAEVIRGTHRELGRDIPWFVAQATYHTPDDPGSAEVRAAQAALWKSGLALEGPDTDALTGAMRDGGGRGVHFSGAGLKAHGRAWAAKVGAWLAGLPGAR